MINIQDLLKEYTRDAYIFDYQEKLEQLSQTFNRDLGCSTESEAVSKRIMLGKNIITRHIAQEALGDGEYCLIDPSVYDIRNELFKVCFSKDHDEYEIHYSKEEDVPGFNLTYGIDFPLVVKHKVGAEHRYKKAGSFAAGDHLSFSLYTALDIKEKEGDLAPYFRDVKFRILNSLAKMYDANHSAVIAEHISTKVEVLALWVPKPGNLYLSVDIPKITPSESVHVAIVVGWEGHHFLWGEYRPMITNKRELSPLLEEFS